MGIQITQLEWEIFISQHKYFRKLSRETKVIDCKPCENLNKLGLKFITNEEGT